MNKTILITGASSGIGYELAMIAARNGHTVILAARRREKLQSLSDHLQTEYNATVFCIPIDLSEQGAPARLYQFVQVHNLHVDYLVNNAGFGDMHDFRDAEAEKLDEMIRLHVQSLTIITKLFLADMLRTGYGKIMHVASTAAFQPGPGMAVYYATKAYVLSFSQALSQELKGSGVTVTALCPGPTLSEFQEVAGMGKSPLFRIMPVPDSKKVAEYGYQAMIKGKRVAIEGLLNRVLANSVKFFPRAIVLPLIHTLQKSRQSKSH